MTAFCGMSPTSNHFRFLVVLVLLVRTSTVHLAKESSHEQLEFVTVGEFKFCRRSRNTTIGSPATCKSRAYAPEYKTPSMTALTDNIIIGMQYAMGLNKDWQSACIMTAEIKGLPCACNSTNHKPDFFSIIATVGAKMVQHPVEAMTLLTFSQIDVYVRTRVLDDILNKAIDDNQFDQAVFLGTGFDTRPYNDRSGMGKIPKIFETDLKEGAALKHSVLEKCQIAQNTDGQVEYLHLNLLEKQPFNELWGQQSFKAGGHTLIIAEHVFGYVDAFANMNWIRQLRDTVIKGGGTAMLVLMATRGANFDATLAPICYNQEECLLSQMPLEEKRSNTYMRALGWEKVEGYDDFESEYRNLKLINWQESGFVGVFTAIGIDTDA